MLVLVVVSQTQPETATTEGKMEAQLLVKYNAVFAVFLDELSKALEDALVVPSSFRSRGRTWHALPLCSHSYSLTLFCFTFCLPELGRQNGEDISLSLLLSLLPLSPCGLCSVSCFTFCLPELGRQNGEDISLSFSLSPSLSLPPSLSALKLCPVSCYTFCLPELGRQNGEDIF